MIDTSDISVIIQGPIDWSIDPVTQDGMTLALTRSIRDLMPGAEIILSTWSGQDLSAMDCDIVCLSVDPGTQGALPGFTPNNVNRQILSTLSGLKKASRPYCLKIRSDMVLESVDYLKHFEFFSEGFRRVMPDERLFLSPILTNNLSSRKTSAVTVRLPDHPLLFHVSDHVQFGQKEDLLKLWDIPLQSAGDALWFLERSHPNRWRLEELSRLAPEQYILTSALGKWMDINIQDFGDGAADLRSLSDLIISTYFVSIPDRSFKVRFPKYHSDHHFSFDWMRHDDLVLADLKYPGGSTKFFGNLEDSGFYLMSDIVSISSGAVAVGTSRKGIAIYGPYLPIAAGYYSASLQVDLLDQPSGSGDGSCGGIGFDAFVITLDRTLGEVWVDVESLPTSGGTIAVDFTIPPSDKPCPLELRVYQGSSVPFIVRSITLRSSMQAHTGVGKV